MVTDTPLPSAANFKTSRGRQEAQALDVLARFPDDRAVALCFLEWEDAALEGLLETLADTYRVLRRAMSCRALSPEVREAARRAERHFPRDAELFLIPGWLDTPRRWIDFYLLGDATIETACPTV